MAQVDLSPRDLPPGPTLGESRERVLAALRAAGGPVDRAEVARRTGLHPNTARFHLDGLVSAGRAERMGAQRGGPGRPRTLYAAITDDVHGRRSYRLLAAILTAHLAGTRRPAAAAAEAGRAWGQLLMRRSPRSRRVGARAATGILIETLTDVGFEPETRGEGRILLHHCPFREAALDQPEVVCGVHLGLMQGVVNEVGDGTIEVERLEPFVEPNLCAATIVKGERRS